MRVLILLLALLGNAHAGVTSQSLLDLIRGSDEEKMGAYGYVIGVIDALNGKVICPTKDNDLEQAMKLVINALNRNQRNPDQPAVNIVVGTMARAWPCGTSI